MNKEEYDKELIRLQAQLEIGKRELIKNYALSNNTVKNGDIVTDHMGSIKVKKIEATVAGFDKYPSCVYYGLELKKDLTLKKKESKRWAYQINLVKD